MQDIKNSLDRRNLFRIVGSKPIVEIKNVSKVFDTVRALDGVTIDIPKGCIIGLLGPNGSGKTTLLKILAGLYKDYNGEILIDGHKIGIETKEIVSYLSDKGEFPKYMKVKEIISIYNTFYDDFDEKKCREMLDVFDISESSTTKEMSKGMVDKLQICLLMSRKAKLYLLDEPIGGVDIEAREHILDLILENFNPNATMIIVTHLIRDIERLFDSVIVLRKGKIETVCEADEIRELSPDGSLEEGLKKLFKGESIN